MIFLPFIVYVAVAAGVAGFIIPQYYDFHGAIFAAYYASLLGGYLFYFIGMRLFISQKLGSGSYFTFGLHAPYMAFLIPAVVIAHYLLPVLVGNKGLLFGAIAGSVMFQFLFYLAGLWMVKQMADTSENRFRFSFFIPLIMFIPGAAAVAGVLIPLGVGKVQWLGISFAFSLLFSIVFYYAGVFLVVVGIRTVKTRFHAKYSIPLVFYLIIAILVAFKAIPAFHSNLLEISIAYGASLYAFIWVYTIAVIWMMIDVRKMSLSDAPA